MAIPRYWFFISLKKSILLSAIAYSSEGRDSVLGKGVGDGAWTSKEVGVGNNKESLTIELSFGE